MRIPFFSFISLMVIFFATNFSAEAAFKLSAQAEDSKLADTNYGIIGVRYLHRKGSFSEVVEIYPNTPASQAGIRVGDMIQAVDDIPVVNFDANQIYQMIGGHPGTQVKLSLMRCGIQCNSYAVNLTRMDLNHVQSQDTLGTYLRTIGW